MSRHDFRWIKAQSSIGAGACLELAAADAGTVLVRNSRDPDVHLRLTKIEMAAFFRGVKGLEFDHLLD